VDCWKRLLLEHIQGCELEGGPITSVLGTRSEYGADIIVARLPKIELLELDIDPDDVVSQLVRCSKLSNIHFNLTKENFLGTPLRTIAACLRMPGLQNLSFSLEPGSEAAALNSIPLRSSLLQHLTLREETSWDYSGGPIKILPAITMHTLLSNFVNLTSFEIQRDRGIECQYSPLDERTDVTMLTSRHSWRLSSIVSKTTN
jgi:hypothetical protein